MATNVLGDVALITGQDRIKKIKKVPGIPKVVLPFPIASLREW
jgi:hypothetical protein